MDIIEAFAWLPNPAVMGSDMSSFTRFLNFVSIMTLSAITDSVYNGLTKLVYRVFQYCNVVQPLFVTKSV